MADWLFKRFLALPKGWRFVVYILSCYAVTAVTIGFCTLVYHAAFGGERHIPDWANEPSKTAGSSCTWGKRSKLNMPPKAMWGSPNGRKTEWQYVSKEWLYWLTGERPWVAYHVQPDDVMFQLSPLAGSLNRIFVCKGLTGDVLTMILVHEFAHKDHGYVDHYGESLMTSAQFMKAYRVKVAL